MLDIEISECLVDIRGQTESRRAVMGKCLSLETGNVFSCRRDQRRF